LAAIEHQAWHEGDGNADGHGNAESVGKLVAKLREKEGVTK